MTASSPDFDGQPMIGWAPQASQGDDAYVSKGWSVHFQLLKSVEMETKDVTSKCQKTFEDEQVSAF